VRALHAPGHHGQGRRRRLDDDAEELVVRLVAEHAESLLRLARRYSICPDDAHDAYQRSLEILIRHAGRLNPEHAGSWLRTVVKREAMAINRSRRRIVGANDPDLEGVPSNAALPEDMVIAFERVERSAAALRQLKPQELRALWLRALGHSYEQIALSTGWTRTKVNRCLAEGRKSFLERYAGLEAGDECARLAPALSALVDGEGGGDVVALRSHLRHCGSCRASMRELQGSARSVAAVFPVVGLTVADVAEPAHHFVVRLYEALSMGLSERTANTMVRAQAVIEAATASKLAAVAAASVAVTGGGLAVDQAVRSGTPPSLSRALGSADALSLPGAATGAHRAATARSPARRHRAARAKPKAHPARKRAVAARRAAPARRIVVAAAPARAAPAPAATAPRPAAPAPQPAAASATAAPARAAASSPAPAAASSHAPAAGGGSAAGEFGFEGG
jgi:RNA polymerase sigma factor (sigma-70 family)